MTTTNLDRNAPGNGWGVDDDTDEGEEAMDDDEFTVRHDERMGVPDSRYPPYFAVYHRGAYLGTVKGTTPIHWEAKGQTFSTPRAAMEFLRDTA